MNPVFLFIVAVLPAAAYSKDYFTAAVFEHRPRVDKVSAQTDLIEIKNTNLQFFVKAAEVAAEKGADITIFNEYGFFPYPFERELLISLAEHVPDPKLRKFNPCTEGAGKRFVLQSMSCLARKHKMYIVANMLDIQPCQAECDAKGIKGCNVRCPDDGVYVYNTDVAFDREGNIVARYHKGHPYFELVDTPEDPEFVIFDTDFGRFGLIVCFDIIFQESRNLVKDYKVDTMIFPTYWFDDIELFNAVELQQAWALANGVNLLGANAQSPNTGTLGSGIYSKHSGALVYTYENDGESKLLVANLRIKGDGEVPQINTITVVREDQVFIKEKETGELFPDYCYEEYTGPAKDKHHDYRCFKIQTANFTLSKLQSSSGSVKSCNNGFCCTLNYVANDMQEDWYLASLNGTNNVHSYYHWWDETCMLLRCDPLEGKPCAMQPSNSKTIFKSLELRGTFQAQRIYATVSKSKSRLAPKTEWNYSSDGSDTVMHFKSNSNVPLLKAGLLGRNYELDPPFDPWYMYTVPEKKVPGTGF